MSHQKKYIRDQRRGFNLIGIVHEIRSLSSGTVAKLCGCSSYEIIDAYVTGWVQWVLKAHDMTDRWASWQDCHERYEQHLEMMYELGNELLSEMRGGDSIAAMMEDEEDEEDEEEGR